MALFDKRTRPAPISPSAEHPDGDTSSPMVPVLAMIAGNVLLLAEERPLTTVLPSSVLAQLDLLTRHHDWIAAQLWVDVYFGELRDVRQHLKSAVRDRTHILVGYCDLAKEGEPEQACGGALILENGGDTVQCKGCGATWTDPRERARLAMRTG
jgi:hypothetical protein